MVEGIEKVEKIVVSTFQVARKHPFLARLNLGLVMRFCSR